MTVTEEAYAAAVAAKHAAESVINQFFREKAVEFQMKLDLGTPFTDEDLIYAAYNLCPCGHGMAYPRDCGGGHYWDCSAILKGIANDPTVKHTDRLPFSMYSIKSEGQPSANGATTRGVFKPKEVSTDEHI